MRLISKTVSGEYNLDKFQDEVKRVVDPIAKHPLLDGSLLSSISLTTGITTHVPHNLDSAWTMWMLVGNSANSVVYEATTQLKRDSFLSLNCSANTTVSIYVR